MHRKLVLAAVLCLAAVALLGIAAAPAAAQGSCDCHTAVPPTNGAPAAHAPYVASVTNCTVCHKGWDPHPEAASVKHPGLRLGFLAATHSLGGVLSGLVGVNVYLQQRPWGGAAWTDLTKVTTQPAGGYKMPAGRFGFTVPSPTAWAAYRAVSEGVAGSPVNTAAKRVWRPTPVLRLNLSALSSGVVRGTVRPLKVAGEKVSFLVRRLTAGKYVTGRTGTAVISAKGTYMWTL